MKSNRREFLIQSTACAAGLTLGLYSCAQNNNKILNGVQDFIHRVANPDGSFRPGIDPAYKGTSDTGLSGIAAPTYATILCRTFGWDLPYPEETREFFLSSQKPDGAFYHTTGSMDPDAPLSKLYNTTQSIVALRLLGTGPTYDPMPVIEYFFANKQFSDLPLYTTSFFPLFFCAYGEPMPDHVDRKMQDYILSEQAEDGYLQDHVAATFHAAHYFRLTGRPTPKAGPMVERVLKDQQDDGSWHLFEQAWDVHACFDALFILKQVGNQQDPRIREAYKKANDWILSCRQPDGGFTHFPDGKHSDMDAVYFQAGGLVESGYLKARKDLDNEEILGWGHAMDPDKQYFCL